MVTLRKAESVLSSLHDGACIFLVDGVILTFSARDGEAWAVSESITTIDVVTGAGVAKLHLASFASVNAKTQGVGP